MSELFGEIRSILALTPSQESFLAIWEVLGKASLTEMRYKLVPYCQEHMASWPSYFCRMSSIDTKDPRYALVKTLDWSMLDEETEESLDYAEAILNLPSTTRLEALDLTDARMSSSKLLAIFIRCRAQLQSIRGLYLRCTLFNNHCAEALSQFSETTSIDTLDIASTDITDTGIKLLARAPCLKHLEYLNLLMTSHLYDDTLVYLKDAIFRESLRSLNLVDLGYSDEGLASFFKAAPFPNLKSLLAGHITHRYEPFLYPDALAVLADSPWAEGLTHLDLEPLSDRDRAVISVSSYLSDEIKRSLLCW